jgi:hypothetical protein
MLGPSPLYAAVSLDWAPAVRLLPGEVLREVCAWIEQHGFDFPDGVPLTRVVITDAELMLWRLGDPGAGGRRPELGPTVAPLRSHPSTAMLLGLVRAGVLACGAILLDEEEAEKYRCNVLVDDRGRHAGDHADGRFGDQEIGVGLAQWPNGNTSDMPPPPPPLVPIPPLAKIRGVMAGALWLCHHDPAHPLSYTDPDTCKTCQAIDRAAAAVHALIGAS